MLLWPLASSATAKPAHGPAAPISNIARHACARSIPVTIPSRAERLCRRIAIRFDIASTQINA